MSAFNRKLQGILKEKKKVILRDRASKATNLNTDMTEILELSEQEFKMTMINKLRVLMKKVDMKELTGNSKIITIKITKRFFLITKKKRVSPLPASDPQTKEETR